MAKTGKTQATAPQDDIDELDNTIENMLNNTILDWNSPSQLTSVNATDNYIKLIPAIKALIHDREEKAIADYQTEYEQKHIASAVAVALHTTKESKEGGTE